MMEPEESQRPIASVVLKAINFLAVGAAIGVVLEFVFSAPASTRDSYLETFLLGLCYTWGAWCALAFVYHVGVVLGDNMRVLGGVSVALAVLLAAGVFFFLPPEHDEQRIFWALLGMWVVFAVISLVAGKRRKNQWVPPKDPKSR